MDKLQYTNFINILKNNKIKIIFPSVVLSATLVLGGCSSVPENENVDTGSSDIVSSVVADGADQIAIVFDEETSVINRINEKISDADTVVEKSITGTIELAKSISSATDEYRQTEQYKQDVERLKTEFDTLVNWVLGKTEIDGYTIKDVGNETIDLAKEAISYIDEVIESYIPDYKDKAKEKLSELGDTAWDIATDLGALGYDKAQEFKDDVLEKSKGL